MKYTPNEDSDFEATIRGEIEGDYATIGTPTQGKKSDGSDIDFASIEAIFQSPEYKHRQYMNKVAQEQEYLRYQQEMKKRRINLVNKKLLQKKLKLQKTLIKVGITITVIGCLAIFVFSAINDKDKPIEINPPTGYVTMMINVDGDNIDNANEIASKFYREDLYGDLDNFEQIIIAKNDLSKNGTIYNKDTITVPVFVDVNNPVYQELKKVEAQIQKIKEEAYWVEHTISYGDTISGLASKASGSYAETIQLVNDIMAKNNLPNSLIYEGQTIYIINPALGNLKVQFNQLRDALIQSLIVDQTKK